MKMQWSEIGRSTEGHVEPVINDVDYNSNMSGKEGGMYG